MSDLWIHPSAILLAGAALLPLVPTRAKRVWLLLVPSLVFLRTTLLVHGTFGQVGFLEWKLVFGRVDGLSLVFGYIMALMAILGSLYALQVREDAQHIAAWTYVAGSLGAIYAGDYLTLFLFWEVMALSSVFLIWFRRRRESLGAGYRYFLVHTAGGLALLAGLVWHASDTGGDLSRSGSLTWST